MSSGPHRIRGRFNPVLGNDSEMGGITRRAAGYKHDVLRVTFPSFMVEISRPLFIY